jgi:hypothetical protein
MQEGIPEPQPTLRPETMTEYLQRVGSQPEPAKQDHIQAILITSLVWLVIAVVAAFIAYRQGESHAVNCMLHLGIGC